MKITFVIPHADLTGGLRVIATYAERLRLRGHDVTVVSRPKRPPSMREILANKLLGKPLPWATRTLPRTHLDGLGVTHRVIDGYRPITPDDLPDADVLIPTWWQTLEWVWPAPSSKGVKVQFMQDYETFGGDAAGVDRVCRLPVKRIVIAQWVKDLLARKYDQRDVVLISNAVDTERFDAPTRGRQAVPTVGTVYTGFVNKGTDVALAAFALARKQLPDLRLVMFGADGVQPKLPIPEGGEYQRAIPDDRLRDVYSRCDAWLFGTRIEGFGLPILEAMACRTPVIATPAGAAPELVSEGGGVLVPMEDSPAMADAIVRLVRCEESEWRRMSDLAYATARRRTWEPSVDKFEAVLLEAAGKGIAG